MILSDVMDELGVRMDTVSGLRVYAFPPDTVSPPAAIIGFPDEYTYDATYGRGSDRMTLPVIVVVGRLSDRSARDRVSAYVSGSGTSSIKACLDGQGYTSCDTVRVASVDIESVSIGGTDHLAAIFHTIISGKGA